MKTNVWMLFGILLSTSLLAQQATNVTAPSPAETPAPAAPSAIETPAAAEAAKTNAPAAKSGKKKAKAKQKSASPAKPASEATALKTVPLVPGPAIVDASNVNVRGQARLKGEVVTRLTKGQAVTVLEEIVNNNSAGDEPSAWAKILLPPEVPVWVNSSFLDSNRTVLPKKLNVRNGPGENYSVLGLFFRGETLKELGNKGEWLKVEAPTNAYGFIAAQYLKQEAGTPSAVATTTPSAEKPAETPVTPSTVAEAPTVAPAATETPAMAASTEKPAEAVTPAETPAVAPTPATLAAAPKEAESEAPPKRVVQREGLVRATKSITAPTEFGLYSTEDGKIIDYLYTTSTNLDLRRYKGFRLVITGPESLDDRWSNTPVLTIEKLKVNE